MSQAYQDLLVSLLPKMRVWALSMTRNSVDADDLVQDVATKVLGAERSFTMGTNFSAWVHRIMVNHFIGTKRNSRDYTNLENIQDISIHFPHEECIVLRELAVMLPRLPTANREVLSMIALEERSYEEISRELGQPVGTLKSRVHRAREQLRSYVAGESASIAA